MSPDLWTTVIRPLTLGSVLRSHVVARQVERASAPVALVPASWRLTRRLDVVRAARRSPSVPPLPTVRVSFVRQPSGPDSKEPLVT